MNRPSPTHHFAAGPWVLVAMIVAAALTRLLPHPPNFSPVEAMALFGGAYFANRRWAFLVPVLGLLVSDFALAYWHGGSYGQYLGSASFWAVYAAMLLSVFLGLQLRGRVTGARVLGYALAGSVVFFVVSNAAVWLFQGPVPMYPMTAAGLLACYVAAIPFFQWTVLGTLFYSAVLFGGFALVRRHAPGLFAQTA